MILQVIEDVDEIIEQVIQEATQTTVQVLTSIVATWTCTVNVYWMQACQGHGDGDLQSDASWGRMCLLVSLLKSLNLILLISGSRKTWTCQEERIKCPRRRPPLRANYMDTAAAAVCHR